MDSDIIQSFITFLSRFIEGSIKEVAAPCWIRQDLELRFTIMCLQDAKDLPKHLDEGFPGLDGVHLEASPYPRIEDSSMRGVMFIGYAMETLRDEGPLRAASTPAVEAVLAAGPWIPRLGLQRTSSLRS